MTPPTDEQVAAFADGELTGAEHDAVAAAVAADPNLAARVAVHRALRDRLGAHYAPILEQPVPDRLAALLEAQPEGGVVSFAQARTRWGLPTTVRRWAPLWGAALAASLVLVVVLPRGGEAPSDVYAGAELAQALDTQLSGEAGDTRVLLSFADTGGDLCRVYSGAGASGIACRDRSGWRIERTATGLSAQGTDYRQAGSDESALLAAAQDMASGGAFDAAAERAARARGWKR